MIWKQRLSEPWFSYIRSGKIKWHFIITNKNYKKGDKIFFINYDNDRFIGKICRIKKYNNINCLLKAGFNKYFIDSEDAEIAKKILINSKPKLTNITAFRIC